MRLRQQSMSDSDSEMAAVVDLAALSEPPQSSLQKSSSCFRAGGVGGNIFNLASATVRCTRMCVV